MGLMDWMTSRKFRFTEEIIPLGVSLYVLGTAVPTKDEYPKATQKGVIQRTKAEKTLLISDKSESELSLNRRYWVKLILGAAGIVIAGLLFILLVTNSIPHTDAESSANLMGISIVALVFSVFFLYLGFKELSTQQKIESLPTSRIKSMAMGLVEVKGKAEPIGEPIKSVLTRTPCLGYSYTIEEYIQAGKNSHWKALESGKETPMFYLNDRTGVIPVDPAGARLEISMEETLRMETKNLREIPGPAQEFLRKGNVKDIKYREDSERGY